jgi:hypothetical protein
MDKDRLENVIVKFAQKFENLKPLARELRHVLFPIRDEVIFTGTFHDQRWDDHGVQHGNRPSGEGGTGNCIEDWGVRIVRRIVGSFSFFLFATKGVRKTVLHNDTRDANKRATYCIIHQLFPIKTMRLMSAFDDTGRQRDKVPFRYSSRQTPMDK